MPLPTPPRLRHVMSVRFRTSRTISQNHPEGDRLLLTVDEGMFRAHRPQGDTEVPEAGKEIEGTVQHGSDWVVRRADGSLDLDVRVQLQAADGTVVLMTYHGSSVEGRVRSAPRFSAPADSPLAWLNTLVCVAEGTVGPEGVDYEVWAC